MQEDDSIPWYCLPCQIVNWADTFPFGFLTKSELLDLYGVDLPSQLASLPSLEITSRLEKLPHLQDFDLDENLVHSINSNYRKVSDLAKISTDHMFSLFHVNIRSLSKHFGELQSLINSTKIPFDIIGVTESKQLLNTDFAVNVSLDGYHIHSQPTKSTHGGVVMYVNKHLDYTPRDDLSVLEDEFETLWIEIKTGSKAKNILCCCVYRHPNTDTKKFIGYMDNVLSKISKTNKLIFVMGDFNINLLSYEAHSETNEFINTMVSHYSLPYILHPTRVTDHSSTVIDNIFSNVTDYETVSGNIINQIADHFAQFMMVKRININYKNTTFYQYDYSNFKKENFIEDISNINWETLHNSNEEINNKFAYFYDQVSTCVKLHAPLEKVSPKKLSFKNKPWITARIQRMMSKRDKYLNKFRRTKSRDSEYLYKKFRNKVVLETRKNRVEYFNNYFNTNKNNMKKLWAGIRSVVNVGENKCGIQISHLTQDGKEINDPQQMANIFNNFFVNVSKKITNAIPRTRKSPLDYLKHFNEKSFLLSAATPNEIEDLINSFQEGKAVGPYSIPIKLLKMISYQISVPFCIIVNESFVSGVFPDRLKLAKVITIYKKDSKDNPTNYRPISLLSIFSKLIEKLMCKRLYSFLDSCNILHSLQFGFREKHSTLHALIGMTETIKESIDNGTFGCGVFVDLQKAFDTVNHTILLKKLEYYGVRGNVLNWFSSYLCNRKQYVSVNGATSDQLTITCGVPQGSVLGPLLFLIYINDLPTVSRLLSFCLFADDTNIYFSSSDLLTLQKVMNRELKKVKKWLDANQLALNIEKTNFVIFHSPQRKIDDNIVIKFMRKKISRKTSVKFLGILLDAHLSWKQQITELSKKLARTVGIFYKIRHFVPLETLKVLYFSLFYSFVSYGIAVWGLTHKSLLNPLIISQKKIVRIMCFEEPTAHTEPLFKKLQFLKVRDIHELQLLSFIYDCQNKIAPAHFHSYFTPCYGVHSINTRQASRGDLFLTRKTTFQYGIRSIQYSGAVLWNSLPVSIRNSPSHLTFVSKLRTRVCNLSE